VAFLSFRNVECRRGDRTVLDDVSFELDEAETLVLLGRSGSGKTTVIRLINRSLDFDAGDIQLNHRDLRDMNVIELRRRIGYVIQEIGLLPHWTVARNIAMVPVLERWPHEKSTARVRELMAQVGLPYEQYADRLPHQLSGGQRQRVGVARALAAHPALLLFDEPFGALDPVTRRDMQTQFISLRNEYRVPAIFVTHDVAEALRLGTRIAVLDQGRLELIATRKEFLQAQTPVARSFLDTLISREDLAFEDRA
jgi:osmoprotectant transport system ATP-binding protein